MNIVITVLTVILFLNCLLMVAVILVQRGKGGGLAAAFGAGGGAESPFGARAATTIKKATAVLAVVYILMSATLYKLRTDDTAASTVANEPIAPVSAPAMPTAPEAPADTPAE